MVTIGDLKAMVEGTDNRIKTRPVVRIGVRRRCQGKTTEVVPGLAGRVIVRGARKGLSVVEIRGEDVKAYLDLLDFRAKHSEKVNLEACG